MEFDDRGHLKHIVNLDKALVVSFIEQGFYWYASKYHPILCRFKWVMPSCLSHLRSRLSRQSNYARITCIRCLHLSTVVPRSTTCESDTYHVSKSIAPTILLPRKTYHRNCTITETVQKASIVFNDWISQEFNLYRGVPSIELEWIVGPIPVEDNVGKEIILRYDTNIESAAKYYTDANGREVLERIRDHRPTWPYVVDEPITGNYYPINSRIWIRDRDRQLTVLTGNTVAMSENKCTFNVL